MSRQYTAALFCVAAALVTVASSGQPVSQGYGLPHAYEQAYPPPLRWDAIEGRPYQIGGPKNEDGAFRLRRLDRLRLRLPAGAWLRIHDPEAPLCRDEFEVMLSDGSGLFRRATPEATASPYDLVFADHWRGERVVQVQRARGCGGRDQRPVQLYMSRVEPLPPVAPLRQRQNIEAPGLTLRTDFASHYQDFQPLYPDEVAWVEMSGPARVRVDTRLLPVDGHPIFADDTAPPCQGCRQTASCPASTPLASAPQLLRLVRRLPRNVDHYALAVLRDDIAAPACGPSHVSSRLSPAAITRLNHCPGAVRAPWRRLDYDTAPDYTRPPRINGCLSASGQLESRWLELPPGRHRLGLSPSTAIAVRIMQRDSDDFLLPGLNAPRPAAARLEAAIAQPRHGDPAFKAAGLYRLDHALTQRRDNGFRDGALRAAGMLARTASDAVAASQLQARGRQLWRRQSYWRDVLPWQAGSQGDGGFAWVLPWRMVPMHEPRKRLLAQAQQTDALLMSLGSAYFLAFGQPGCTPAQGCCRRHPLAGCPTGLRLDWGSQAALPPRMGLSPLLGGRAVAAGRSTDATPARQRYRLPERAAATQLRLLVDSRRAALPQVLWLQFDQQPPQRVELEAQRWQGPAGNLPDLGELGLIMVQDELRSPDPVGFWGRLGLPQAPLLRPASVEFDLPPAVQEISIWPDRPAGQDLRIGLQYREAKPYQLSESDYPLALAALPRDWLLPSLLGIAAALPGAPSHNEFSSQLARLDTGPMRRLAPHWLPLIRVLHDREQRFRAGVGAQGLPPAALVSQPSGQESLREARDHALAGRHLNALEFYNRALRALGGEAYREAVLGLIAALDESGETSSAERILRGLVLHNADAVLREAAYQQLMTRYAEAAQQPQAEGLLVAMMQIEPGQAERYARELVRQFVEQGRDDLALSLGLLLKPCPVLVPLLVEASYRLRWWTQFEQLIERLPPQDRAWWRGLQAQRVGDQLSALSYWEAAGVRGQSWREALATGQQIAAAIRSPSAVERIQALRAWQAWQQSRPGSWAWRYAPELVSAHAGGAHLHSATRDLLVPGFTATPERPVVLKVQGPTRLLIEARPLGRVPGQANAPTPIDSWLMLRHNGETKVHPVNHNRSVDGFRRLDAQAMPVHRSERTALSLPAGAHEIEIWMPERAVYVRPQVLRPLLPLSVLPELSPALMVAVARGDGLGEAYSTRQQKIESCSTRSLLGLRRLPWNLDGWHAVDRQLNARPAQHCSAAHCLAAGFPPAPVNPRAHTALLSQLPEQGSAWPHLVTALWQIEQARTDLPAAIASSEAVADRFPATPGLAGLLRRLRSHGRWASVEPSSSAGQYELDRTQPASPGLRARLAQLAPAQPGEQRLYGADTLGLRVINDAAETIWLRLRLESLPYLPAQPQTLQWQIDGGAPMRQEILPDQTTRIPLRMTAGAHMISLQVADGRAGHFLSLAVTDATDQVLPEPEITRQQRVHASTPKQPLALQIPGPAWLRIDRHLGPDVHSEYRYLAAAETQLSLPSREKAGALYQVARREVVLQPNILNPVPDYPAVLSAVSNPPTCGSLCQGLRLLDRYPPGGQEDGTRQLDLALVNTRAVDEQPLPGTDRYLELGYTWRELQPLPRLFHRSRAFLRLRRDEQASAGLTQRWRWWPRERSWFAGAWLGGVVQDSAVSLRGREYWTRYWRFGEHWTNYLSGGADQYWLSHATPPGGVSDVAVFSRFKRDHPWVWFASERLHYRPWLDSELRLGLEYRSNSRLDPLIIDSAAAQAEWRQLAGPIEGRLAYRHTRYYPDRDRLAASESRRLRLNLIWDVFSVNTLAWPSRCALSSACGCGRPATPPSAPNRASHRRLFAELELTALLDQDQWLAMLRVGMNWSNARGYRDFELGELGFMDLRDRRAAALPNNAISGCAGDER